MRFGSSSRASRWASSASSSSCVYVVCAFGAALDLALRSRGHRFRRHAVQARRASTGSAPTSTAATCSRASSTARARRWRSASSRRVAGCTLGALVGAASGYFGGRIDNAIQRVVDIMLSFPIIVLAMVVVAVLGKRTLFGVDLNLICAITLPIAPEDGARGARLDAVDHRHAVHRCGARGGLLPQAHHPAPHHPQHRRALPDHGVGLHGAGDPAGGEPVVPGAGRDRADAGLGPDAVGHLAPTSTRPRPG